MKIDGKTALYLVVGDPIAQVKSPGLYTDWCVAHDVNVNERSKLTRLQHLILTRLSDGKAPRRAALI